MNIVICDDEVEELQKIRTICEEECTDEDYVECYHSSTQLYDILHSQSPKVDLFLLDIEMPQIDGLELKRQISELYMDTNIVFLTTHDEMMARAFGKKVLGFLQKKEYEQQLREIIRAVRKEIEEEDIIPIPGDKEGRSISKDRIVTIQAQHIYSTVQTISYYNCDKKMYETKTEEFRMSLGKWEKLLQDVAFYKISRNCIVHFKYVKRISEEVILDTDEKIHVPVRKLKELKQAYNQYCAGKTRCIL